MHSKSVTALRRPPIGEQIKATFADGQWRPVETMVKTLDLDAA